MLQHYPFVIKNFRAYFSNLYRRNVLRTERDRRHARELDAELAAMRKGVPENLGPVTEGAAGAPSLSVQGPQPVGAQPAAPAGGSTRGGGALDPVSGILALSLAGLALSRRWHVRGRER